MALALRTLTRPCTIRYWSPGTVDEHNDPVDTYLEVDTFCAFQQRARQEMGDVAQVSTETWLIFLAPDEQIPHAADQVVVEGITYEFTGDATLEHTSRGALDHIEGTCGKAV
jgi:hypothetical protein